MSRHTPSWLPIIVAVLVALQSLLPAVPVAAPRVAAAAAPATPPAVEVIPPAAPASPAAPGVFLPLLTGPAAAETQTAAPASDAAALQLAARCMPAWAEPGAVVACAATATNVAAAPLPGLTLTAALPPGLVYVAASAVGFADDPRSGPLTWPAGTLAAGATITGSFGARVQGLALGETVTLTVTASSPALVAGQSATATVAVAPPAADEVGVTAAAGGWLRSTDGRLELRVPPGAVTHAARVRYCAASRSAAEWTCGRPTPAQGGLLAVFAVEVRGDDPAERGEARFGQPAELRVRIQPAETAPGWGSCGCWRGMPRSTIGGRCRPRSRSRRPRRPRRRPKRVASWPRRSMAGGCMPRPAAAPPTG